MEQALFQAADVNDDGVLSFDEFRALLLDLTSLQRYLLEVKTDLSSCEELAPVVLGCQG